MAKYKDKWKTTFPASIGNQTRPEDGVDNTQEYNTDGLPQYMANDPVRYDLQNAVNSQLVSNDERLNEKIKRTSDDLAAHNKDPKAHVTGIAGNAATASKLITPRTISLTGKAAGSTTFDGSSNAAINVTSVNADTASKLSTARKINITGNATGSATFDGTSDVSINVSVSQAAHADRATQDTNGRAFTDTNAYMHISALADNTDFNNVKTTGIYYCTGNTYPNRPYNAWGILTVYSIGTVKQEYRPDNAAFYYARVYNNANWTEWSKVNAANADTATKLATARAISLTGNASGSANFDGSGNVSINTTVNESKHAAAADSATTATKVNATAPNGGATDLVFGIMANDDSARIRVGGSSDNGWLEIATSDNGNEPIYARQYSGSFLQDGAKSITNEAVLLDGSGNTKFPHNVTAANFKGHLAGNADTATHATTADNVSGKIYYSSSSPSVATDKLFVVKQAHVGEDNVPNNGLVIQSGPTGANYNGKLYLTDNGNDGVWIGGVAEGKEVGWTRLVENKGTWNISISGNADTVDGYHASDLFRHLGGNQTPVITDIFDRAGTIDMTTMSAADKAAHKANINKARNASQNIWNTDTGITAYGGDYDMSNGYGRGSLKLTQSYKNFDKILVVGAEDHAGFTYYKLWDVWELANAFANNDCFMLITNTGNYWMLVGTAKHGNVARKLSTDTIWSCQQQNSAIVAIYGIKY
nr:MAG: hypothetical protein [Bacteriophage sp.]